jgi:ferredoxin
LNIKIKLHLLKIIQKKMLREVVNINEDLCNGCGDCVPNCHEGALQIIDNKARLINDILCDGLGACIGHCPLGAITIEKREAEPYSEVKTMELMVEKGINTVLAHLKHLKDHKQTDFLNQGLNFLKENEDKIDFNVNKVITAVNTYQKVEAPSCGTNNSHAGGSVLAGKSSCPGSAPMSFEPANFAHDSSNDQANMASMGSQLRQWPVQMHLINPMAPYFINSDLLIAADCVAFAMGNFHNEFIKGKSIGIACPKLDSGKDIYIQKLIALIDEAKVNTITVAMMSVPCCGGLLQMVQIAASHANRKVPIKAIVVSPEGKILSEEWK